MKKLKILMFDMIQYILSSFRIQKITTMRIQTIRLIMLSPPSYVSTC
jgi:hypothetical protein